jgi:hypothetical protein
MLMFSCAGKAACAASALQVFNAEWESLIRLQLTEVMISRAAGLAWEHGLKRFHEYFRFALTSSHKGIGQRGQAN